jgi:glutathione S-transferase
MPMQRIVGDALRQPGEKDPRGVAEARAMLDRCYAWLDRRLRARNGRRRSASPLRIAPRLRLYFIRTGCIPSNTQRLRLIEHDSCPGHLWPASWRKHALIGEFFPLGTPERD